MIDGTLLDVAEIAIPRSARTMAQRALSAEDFAKYEAVRLHRIVYASAGRRIHGFLALPAASAERLPAVIFNRGGSGPRGALSAEGAMQTIGLYAAWGYVGVASNYRGVGGSEGTEEWGAGDTDDALALLPFLNSLDYVDQDRLGLVGGSRGGMMAFQMLAATHQFRAAVTFGAPTMISREKAEAYIRRTMVDHLPAEILDSHQAVQHEAERRSVLQWAEQLCRTTPLLLLHGTGDRRVPAEHALQLAMRLQELEHPYKLIMYDNADHVLAGRRNESNADVRWWLDTYVMRTSPLPRTGPHGA
jgi:dipeptidyl aminopeptidase/acylaminoacyl peptidase